MKKLFRKNDRTKSEELLKRSAIQDSIGATGSELRKDFLISEEGEKIDCEFTIYNKI